MNKIAWATGAGRTSSRLGETSSAGMDFAQTKLAQCEQFLVSFIPHIGPQKFTGQFGEYLQQNPKYRHGQCLFLLDFPNNGVSAEIAINGQSSSFTRDQSL